MKKVVILGGLLVLFILGFYMWDSVGWVTVSGSSTHVYYKYPRFEETIIGTDTYYSMIATPLLGYDTVILMFTTANSPVDVYASLAGYIQYDGSSVTAAIFTDTVTYNGSYAGDIYEDYYDVNYAVRGLKPVATIHIPEGSIVITLPPQFFVNKPSEVSGMGRLYYLGGIYNIEYTITLVHPVYAKVPKTVVTHVRGGEP